MSVEAEAFEAAGLQLLEQHPAGAVGVERPPVDRRHRDAGARHRGGKGDAGGHDELAGLEHREFVAEQLRGVGSAVFSGGELAGGQIEQRDAEEWRLAGVRDGRHGHEKRRFACVENVGVRQRAGRHDADDLAFDEALRLPRILDLIADGDAEALLHEPRDVGVDGVVGHAAHRDAAAIAVLGSRRQRQLERARRDQRIVVEDLVEISHAKQQQRVAMLIFRVQVLAHRRSRRR